ncbi:secondary thiamine-phosphate synthase enzyme YjbQ [Legionella spiritensis]|uniref:Secondary thiamine-phosphate synthase enzyme n=1 Tax=Legionella spiritensis TaxID=452 RepID=A0A0W0Z942_LEGSP|nr:secondary thiamine-phosphate synthase enzyme YjbQ [Legionella spiritensis]KTD65648.1 hypothetical protein Lspi_0360 [Legionella spiritensis]SNV43763.1 Uncharacterized conserved protein [Legionella spiritensis]
MVNSPQSPVYWQCECIVDACPRGFHLITDIIKEELTRAPKIQIGLLHLFLQHTSASLTISENTCADVPHDLETHLNELIPDDNKRYRHSLEGPDDMPAHIKNVLLGTSLTIPVARGILALGQWQGIFLCEHRNQTHKRRIMMTLHGF